jgi:CRISPR-associated protein Cas5d
MDYPPLEVKVWGELACFTRPEMKVERVSYEVMTPSAARGVLESVFWKPQFLWRVREVRVLRPVRFFSILRNEVNSRAVPATAHKWEREGGGYVAEDDRAQRHTLALRDVAYIIVADVEVAPGVEENAAKYRDQFRRRVERGQHFIAPYLGCREFPASVAVPDGSERPQELTVDLGRMLFDLDYVSDGTGRGQPRFFAARLERGVLRVPPELYVRRERAG